MKCLWNIHKGNRCKRNCNLLLCWQHWKKVGLISLITGFFVFIIFVTDSVSALKMVKDWAFPPAYQYDEQSNTIRGILIPKEKFINNDTLVLSAGLNYNLKYQLLKHGEHIIACGQEGGKIHIKEDLENPFQYNSLFLKVDTDNYLTISVKFVNKNGELICWIRDNKVLMNKNNQFSWKGDYKGLEIIDKKGKVILLIDYFSESNQMFIAGLIGCPEFNINIAIAPPSILSCYLDNIECNKRIDDILKILKPIFDHHDQSQSKRIRKIIFPEVTTFFLE